MPAASLALALRAARTAASAVACTLLALPAAAEAPSAAREPPSAAREPPSAAREPPSAARAPVLVLATFPGAGRIDERAIDLVAAHVRPLGVRLQVVRAGAPRRALHTLLPDARALADAWDARGVLWIDAGSSDELALYAVERGGDQVYGRRIPVPPGQTTAALESLANIAGAVAEELREGRIAGLAEVDVAAATAPPAAPPEPAAAPAPAASPAAAADAAPRPPPPAVERGARPEAPPLPTLAVQVGYAGANFSGEVPWQSAAALRASWAPVDQAVLGLGYDLVPPVTLGDDWSSFELVRHPVSATGQLRLRLPRGFDLQLGARASVDIVERIPQPPAQPTASSPPAWPLPARPPPRGEPLPPPGFPPPWRWPRMMPRQLPPPEARTDVIVSAAPVAELGYALTGWLRLKAMLGVDVLLSQPDAAVHPALALQPDPVRFLAGLGLELGLSLPASPAAEGAVRR
ncbi:hypothetical protein [Sorangium cellulosum]|uniref:hypothetical protein n=1 Tax=Sorangium cellulosum TaxID=56 RepID=UPI0003F678FF|nr:hypothetical protein [Sorangium cellulosum]